MSKLYSREHNMPTVPSTVILQSYSKGAREVEMTSGVFPRVLLPCMEKL